MDDAHTTLPPLGLPRLGLLLPIGAMGPQHAPGDLADAARRIEAAGFSSIWAADSVGRGFFTPDPLVSLATAAGATERVLLGTAVVQAPLQRPLGLARRALTAWLACGDRLLLGLGCGSTKADFDASGVDYDDRFAIFRRTMDDLRALWNGEQVGAAHLDVAAPLLGGPPVLVGSYSGRWIERAAREYAGWIASGTRTWDEIAAGSARFREAGGTRAVISTVMADLTAEGGEPGGDEPINLRCPPDEARRRLERLGELGFSDVAVISFDHSEATLRSLAAIAQS
ncbi:MAG: LLM class flavin-dependent oxidoreductase [Acidimicrobiia bacterium]